MLWVRRLIHRLRFRLGVLAPIRAGHVYRDRITGEQVTVSSVGRQVLLDPHDGKTRGSVNADKRDMMVALGIGILEHVGPAEQVEAADG